MLSRKSIIAGVRTGSCVSANHLRLASHRILNHRIVHYSRYHIQQSSRHIGSGISLDHFVLTCQDLSKTATWYETVLGAEKVEFTSADGAKRLAVKLGQIKLNLQPAGSDNPGVAVGNVVRCPTPGSADVCFVVDGLTSKEVVDHLKKHGVEIELRLVKRTGANFPIRSTYVRDPDGNLIEISVRAD